MKENRTKRMTKNHPFPHIISQGNPIPYDTRRSRASYASTSTYDSMRKEETQSKSNKDSYLSRANPFSSRSRTPGVMKDKISCHDN